MSKQYKEVEALYDNKNMIMHINAKSTEFVPAYLKYLMEYLEVPVYGTEIVFSDGVIWNFTEQEEK